MAPTPSPSHPKLSPEPKLRLQFEDMQHPQTIALLQHAGSALATALSDSIDFILINLYATTHHAKIPSTRSVTLIFRDTGGVAYTTGLRIDSDHKEIHFSLQYLETRNLEPAKLRHEVLGIICHEMVHCYQYNALGTAPGGLIEGIADFVRLNADLAPSHWPERGSKKSKGEKWDQGYEKTAFFLCWLEDEFGKGSAARINQGLRDQKYDEDVFWKKLFGKDIEQLWNSYCESFGNDDGEHPDGVADHDEKTPSDAEQQTVPADNTTPSNTDDEGVLVELGDTRPTLQTSEASSHHPDKVRK